MADHHPTAPLPNPQGDQLPWKTRCQTRLWNSPPYRLTSGTRCTSNLNNRPSKKAGHRTRPTQKDQWRTLKIIRQREREKREGVEKARRKVAGNTGREE